MLSYEKRPIYCSFALAQIDLEIFIFPIPIWDFYAIRRHKSIFRGLVFSVD